MLAAVPTSFHSGERYSVTGPNAGAPKSAAEAQALFDALTGGPGNVKVVSVAPVDAANTAVVFDWLGATLAVPATWTSDPSVVLQDRGPTATAAPAAAASSTGTYVAVGVGVLALGALAWYAMSRSRTNAGYGHALDNPLAKPTLRMEPGYALKRVRGEWEEVVISEDVTDRARIDGYMNINGSTMAVFTLGRSIYAQLPQNLRRVASGEAMERKHPTGHETFASYQRAVRRYLETRNMATRRRAAVIVDAQLDTVGRMWREGAPVETAVAHLAREAGDFPSRASATRSALAQGRSRKAVYHNKGRYHVAREAVRTATLRQELVGKRVQIPAWTDRWMMGDRYGEITGALRSARSGKVIVTVKLDKSGKRDRFYLDDVTTV